MTNTPEIANLVETLAREIKSPMELLSEEGGNLKRAALPPGWTMVEKDDDPRLLAVPRRKIAKAKLSDPGSFIQYVLRHGNGERSTVWCVANYKTASINFKAIINDHGSEETASDWRDHVAQFVPEFSEEWARWYGKNKAQFNQSEFAAFVEENLKDITSIDGSPSGAQMLDMALSFEANQDMKFKSAMRLQSGGVSMSFVQDDDLQTVQKMQVFDRFSIGMPIFWNGDPYRIDARLRYRVRDGKLTFWFELIRADKVLESATAAMIEIIRGGTGLAFFFGDPGV